MKTILGSSVVLLLCATAGAAEPGVEPTAEPGAVANRPPLRLKVGDVRSYMTPFEYRAAIVAPDAERSAVVVEGRRLPPELQSLKTMPRGVPALFWALRHPLQSWRIFLPDVNAPEPGPMEGRIPPREIRRGP